MTVLIRIVLLMTMVHINFLFITLIGISVIFLVHLRKRKRKNGIDGDSAMLLWVNLVSFDGNDRVDVNYQQEYSNCAFIYSGILSNELSLLEE